MRRLIRRCLLVGAAMTTGLVLAQGSLAGAATTASATLYRAKATFSGPVTIGRIVEPLSGAAVSLASYDYEEQEFFASGVAHAFKATAAPSNGRWRIEPTTAASYRTRIIVRRPKDPSRFSGTVVVEWLNESAGESSPDWDFMNPELMASGDAWVGVSAQALGVEGGAPLLGSVSGSGEGLVHQEPERYGSLHHPGDQYALDIFDQIGLGLRSPNIAVFGSLRPRHFLAAGESQSAFYMTTFVDALAPLSHPFDGYFIHSRGGGAAPLNGSSSVGSSINGAVRIRTDLGVPVFLFETQTDLIELGYAAAQQPNTTHIRTWEVAGTSHADAYLIGSAAGLLGCTTPVNSGPQHEVVQAALVALTRWVTEGRPPPEPAPFKLASMHPPTLALDRFGNVVGGVRTPAVEVPVATLSGAAPAGSSTICGLFGSTKAFSPQMLASLYGTKAHYLALYSAALNKAVAQGYILSADRSSLLAQARQVQFPT